MDIRVLKSDHVDSKTSQEIKVIQKECFSDVPEEDIKEDFYAKSLAEIVARKNGKVIGTLHLYKRKIDFDGRKIFLGGIGGVCVTKKQRRKGVATKMLKSAKDELKKEGCDIVCLNIDFDKKLYGVYEKAGFVMMEREISFENIHGDIVKDTGTMFAPLLSKDLFDYVMNSKETFHYGKGYW